MYLRIGLALEITTVPLLMRNSIVGANLSKAKLHNTFLYEALLNGANLHNASLSDANLRGADLSNTELGFADLSFADLGRAKLCNARLSNTYLVNAHLVETNLRGAELRDCCVYGISAWELKLDKTIQTNLIITRPSDPAITVDNLEVAQFIYLLLHNEKIRDVINTITTKVVLILGRFGEHKSILDAIRDAIRKYNYSPVLFDFDKPLTRDFTETVSTLAHLARFIIADITSPSSIPQELQAIVPTLAVPIQPLLAGSEKDYSMFSDLSKKYHWVLPIHKYNDLNDLLVSLPGGVIAPAEAKARELEKR